MVRKILEVVPEDVLMRDLEKYRQRAIELGATDANIITTDLIVVDERVRTKCMFPPCRIYGKCAHCPPNAPDLDLVRGIVKNFRYAIFTKIEVPSQHLAGPGVMEEGLHLPYARQNFEMVLRIQAEAFYDGYYLAQGFGNGSCKAFLCQDADCTALIPGQGCRFPYQSVPSLEALGMDAYLMAVKVGWDGYPIGKSTSPSDVPHGVALGLILIY